MLTLFALLGLFVRYSSAGCKAWGNAGHIHPIDTCLVYSKNATETVAHKWQCSGTDSPRNMWVQKFKYSDESCSTDETLVDEMHCDNDGYGLQCWCEDPVCSEENIAISRTYSPCSDKTKWIYSDMTVVNECFGYPHWPSHKSGKLQCEKMDGECDVIISSHSYYDGYCVRKLTNSPTGNPTVITPAPVVSSPSLDVCTYVYGSGCYICGLIPSSDPTLKPTNSPNTKIPTDHPIIEIYTTSDSGAGGANANNGGSSGSTGVIVGLTITFVVLCCCIVGYFAWKKRNKNKGTHSFDRQIDNKEMVTGAATAKTDDNVNEQTEDNVNEQINKTDDNVNAQTEDNENEIEVRECGQCGNEGAGKVDDNDGNFYCNSCWEK